MWGITQVCSQPCFNAARGFVGGAAGMRMGSSSELAGFNAARGFVGGAALFI